MHRALSAKAIQKKMERYAKAAGMKASCHSLRHTFASNLLENRFRPDWVAGITGIRTPIRVGHQRPPSVCKGCLTAT
jgi:integrase